MAQWKLEREGVVAVLSLDDGKANALLVPELEGLEAALRAAEQTDARALVLTGRPNFFCAGLNLKALNVMPLAEKQALVDALGRAVLRLFLFRLPVVAAVSGHGLGAGAMLALAADVRIFADGSYRFGLNEVPGGFFVPTFAIELARAVVSASRLTELVVHGRVLSPMEALSMHVADAVYSPESLKAAAMIRARGLAELSGPGYEITKVLVRGDAAERARARISAEMAQLASMFDARASP